MTANKKLNIAMVLDSVTHQTAGSFISTLRFAENLRKRGHKVIFLTSMHKGTLKIDNHNGIPTYRFFSIPIPKTGKQFSLAFPKLSEVKDVLKKEGIEIVHVMGPTPSALKSIKAARELGIKIVAHSHTQPENILIYLPKSIRLGKITELAYRYIINTYKKTDIVICPSKFSESIIKKYAPEIKTEVISNGVDISKFKKIKYEEILKKYNLPKDKKKLLFIGRLDPEKCVDIIIKAMPHILKEFKNVHLAIVGRGNLKDELKKLVQDLKLQDHVTFLGRIPDEDLTPVYNAGDIFILPSLVELEGMVVLEAMACGKPILIANSKNSASPYFVEENGFLFRPWDYKDLAEKALTMLKDEKLLKKMAAKSYAKSKDYDINKSVSMLEKVYYSLNQK